MCIAQVAFRDFSSTKQMNHEQAIVQAQIIQAYPTGLDCLALSFRLRSFSLC
jgi:hypothetical protein